jgi:hypothetical protein
MCAILALETLAARRQYYSIITINPLKICASFTVVARWIKYDYIFIVDTQKCQINR